MKLNKLLGLTLLLGAAYTATSCSGFFDVAPKDSLSPATFWKTETDAQQAATACYDTWVENLRNGSTVFYQDVMSDIAYNYTKTANFAWAAIGSMNNSNAVDWFKYTTITRCNFFLENINAAFHTAFPMMDILLPIGISFFTFQILAFTISLFRKDCEMPTLLDYMCYVTFFPQLIVGPVVKHEELMPQIEENRFMVLKPENICRGTLLFSVGCAKKILIANPMIDYATAFYGGNVVGASAAETWCGVMCFVFAYYFDFSGYIDMARGLGHLFGIELPVNFDSPYKATDFGDFWRKWNITISRFFYESIFDNIFRFGDGYIKLVFAVMATFLVSGLWHGAGWHFIAWGAVNGVLVCVATIRTIKRRKALPKGSLTLPMKPEEQSSTIFWLHP